MTYNEKNKQWWIFENPNDKSLSVVYHSNPKWIAERDTLYHVIEHTAYQQALEQIAKLERVLKSLRESLGLIGGMTIDEIVTAHIDKNGGPIDEIDQALAELKKWRGK